MKRPHRLWLAFAVAVLALLAAHDWANRAGWTQTVEQPRGSGR